MFVAARRAPYRSPAVKDMHDLIRGMGTSVASEITAIRLLSDLPPSLSSLSDSLSACLIPWRECVAHPVNKERADTARYTEDSCIVKRLGSRLHVNLASIQALRLET